MSPTKAITTIMLGLTLLGASAADAATVSAARCDNMLTDLGSKQDALTDMEAAVAESRARMQELVAEARTLATIIASKRAAGAHEAEVALLVERRDAALAELEELEKHLAALEGQLDALLTEVDSAERGYIACIESTID